MKTQKSIHLEEELINLINAYPFKNLTHGVNYFARKGLNDYSYIERYSEEVQELRNELKEQKKELAEIRNDNKILIECIKKSEEKQENLIMNNNKFIEELKKENKKLLAATEPIKIFLFQQEMKEIELNKRSN